MTLFTLRTAAIAALWIALSMLGSPPTTAGRRRRSRPRRCGARRAREVGLP